MSNNECSSGVSNPLRNKQHGLLFDAGTLSQHVPARAVLEGGAAGANMQRRVHLSAGNAHVTRFSLNSIVAPYRRGAARADIVNKVLCGWDFSSLFE